LKKKKEKKETSAGHPFGPGGPAAHYRSPRAGPRPLSLFPFSLLSLTPGPHPSVSPLPLSFLLSPPCLAGLPPRPRIPPRPASPPSFPSPLGLPIKAIKHLRSIGGRFPSFAPSRDGRGHQWQVPPPGARSPPLTFLPLALLSSRTNPCASLCLCNTPTRTREPQFPCATASGFRRRRRSIAVGEGLDPRPFSLIFGIARSLTSSCYRRSSSPTPVAAAPRAHRSAARPAAVVEPLCCRLFSAREPAYFLRTR
jgi:hypothetical protein